MNFATLNFKQPINENSAKIAPFYSEGHINHCFFQQMNAGNEKTAMVTGPGSSQLSRNRFQFELCEGTVSCCGLALHPMLKIKGTHL